MHNENPSLFPPYRFHYFQELFPLISMTLNKVIQYRIRYQALMYTENQLIYIQ